MLFLFFRDVFRGPKDFDENGFLGKNRMGKWVSEVLNRIRTPRRRERLNTEFFSQVRSGGSVEQLIFK